MSRIRANQITNQAADGAPTVQHGLIIAGVSTFTGSVSIGGTLTYEDVTNIDSVGLITARNGINVSSGNINASSGRILIGTTTEGHAEGDDLTIATSGVTGMTIRSGTGSAGNIFFSDATSGSAERQGIIRYDHADDAMKFNVNNAEKLRITSGGDLLIGTSTAAIGGGRGLMIASSTGARIKLCDSDAGVTANDGFEIIAGNGGTGYINNKENQAIVISTNNTERMRVSHEGSVGIGTNNSTYELEVHDGTGAAALRMKDGANNVICDLIANSNGGLLRTVYNHPLIFHTNQVERLRIDSSGNVTKPNQPCFEACGASGNPSGATYITFTTVNVNIGSHYSNSTGKFIAPVAGTYFFSFGCIKAGNSNLARLYLYKNGSTANGRQLRMPTGGDGYGENGALTNIITLAANDEIQVYMSEGTIHGGTGYLYFNGYLIG